MLRRSALIFVAALLLSSMVSSAFAGSSQFTFSISPPPIATPVFDVKETDMKIGAIYMNMKSTDPGMDFKLNGYGVDMVGRSSFGSVVAIDYVVGVIYMTGNITMPVSGGASTSMDMTGANVPFSFNLEVQPYKNDIFNIILFAGPAFNITAMSINSSYTILGTTYSDTITTDSYMYGPEGGIQMGFNLGDFHLDVFGMATRLQGTQDTSSTYGGDTSSSIPAYATTSSGADLVYTPWGLKLSSILQKAKQNDSNGFKTSIYQLSWSHKF